MLKSKLTVIFSLFCLVFSQVVFAAPAFHAMSHSMFHSDSNIAATTHSSHEHHHSQISQDSTLTQVKHQAPDTATATDKSSQHDCCQAQASCDNCTTTCSQQRIVLSQVAFELPLAQVLSATQAFSSITQHPHAGHFKALFKPPIFS